MVSAFFAGRSAGAARLGTMVLGVAALLVLGLGGCTWSKYNDLVSGQAEVEAKWSEIDNQYQRRADLVPQLIATVEGAKDFERSVLREVTEARASVGRAVLPEMPTDPAQLEAYLKAQQGLGAALGRLFAVAENYPELKATQAFLSLQDQLEGTENRIAVARRDAIDAVKKYNVSLRRFPGNLVGSWFGFEEAAQLTIDESAREVPKIDFGKDGR